MADQEFLSELCAIAEPSAKAADAAGTEAALLETYEALRHRAETLALAHGSTGVRLAYEILGDDAGTGP